MKKLPCSPPVGILFALVVAIVFTKFSVFAAEKKEASVTQVIKDVRLLTSQSEPRPASVNDSVREGTAVRTGSDSRAELTFADQRLARLGANTVFSFSAGGRDVDLASGAILFAVPKGNGAARVNTGVATAAVTGFTLLAEHHPKSASKIIILEGQGVVSLKGVPTTPCDMHAGQMMIIPEHPVTCPPIYNVDITKIVETAGLITRFHKQLPKWSSNAILDEDPTRIDTLDLNAAGQPTPPPNTTPPPTPHPPPPPTHPPHG